MIISSRSDMVFDPTPIKLNQFVYWDHPYQHPQLGIEVGREFFDRCAERDQALQVLTSPTDRRAVVILAERRMGKTSLLRHLVERLKASPDLVPVQLPSGGSLHSAVDLFNEICDHMSATLGLEQDGLLEEVDGLDLADQLCVLEQLCNSLAGETVVLCLDELDACLEHQETPAPERGKILGLVNALVRPVLKILTCPLILLTLGLFTLVINGFTFWLSARIANWLGIGFYVDGFWPAFWGALIVSIVSVILSALVKED